MGMKKQSFRNNTGTPTNLDHFDILAEVKEWQQSRKFGHDRPSEGKMGVHTTLERKKDRFHRRFFLPTGLPHDNGTGPDLSRSSFYFSFAFQFFVYSVWWTKLATRQLFTAR